MFYFPPLSSALNLLMGTFFCICFCVFLDGGVSLISQIEDVYLKSYSSMMNPKQRLVPSYLKCYRRISIVHSS